jgi:hypothetical protein
MSYNVRTQEMTIRHHALFPALVLAAAMNWAMAQESEPLPPPPKPRPAPAGQGALPPPPPAPPVVRERVPYGSFIEGAVPLYSRVRVKDCDDIAPGAVPMIVAVRDPNLCRKPCKCCPERSVFVQVLVPPCPLRKVDVGSRGTVVELNYGKYEVNIISRKGVVTVEYDD